VRSYEQLLRVHVFPHFGKRLLTHIKREHVKNFIADLSVSTRFARNTLRLIVCALRAVAEHGELARRALP